jgi:DNA replication licensing factor MCM7
VTILCDAVNELLPECRTREAISKDSLDVFIEHRIQSALNFEQQMQGQDQAPEAQNNNRIGVEAKFPAELLRRFEVYFKPRSSIKPMVLRSLRADQVIWNLI